MKWDLPFRLASENQRPMLSMIDFGHSKADTASVATSAVSTLVEPGNVSEILRIAISALPLSELRMRSGWKRLDMG
jgi:hypothetical protein